MLIKVLADGLRQFPQFNASLIPADGTLGLKKYVNIGVAVEIPGGLLVPVIRDADTKSLEEIANEIGELSEKARTKGLPMSEMSVSCITLTSLGISALPPSLRS